MGTAIKLTSVLYTAMLADLARPHPFALERVGFVRARQTVGEDQLLILLTRYHSIPDDEYLEDPTVGARIGTNSLTWAMQACHAGRSTHEGLFHVHVHAHDGETDMSGTDATELPRVVSGLRAVNTATAHGIIIFSLNHGTAWVWHPGPGRPVRVDTISVIGAPLHIFQRGVVDD